MITREMLEPFPANLPGTPQQWRTIAKAFWTLPEKRSQKQLDLTLRGLCLAISNMTGWKEEEHTYATMGSWICQAHPIAGGYWFECNERASDIKRSQIASLIAQELESKTEVTREMLEPFPRNIPGTPEQWRKIARAFWTPPDKRNSSQRLLTLCGLCNALYELTKNGNIYALMGSWHCAIHQNPERWFPYGPRSSDIKRAKIASLIAEEKIGLSSAQACCDLTS